MLKLMVSRIGGSTLLARSGPLMSLAVGTVKIFTKGLLGKLIRNLLFFILVLLLAACLILLIEQNSGLQPKISLRGDMMPLVAINLVLIWLHYSAEAFVDRYDD